MRHSRALRFRAILALGALAAVVLASTAGAGKVFQETIHEEDAFDIEDFCVEGLDVHLSYVLDLKVHVVPHGPNGLAYFLQHGKRSEVITNVANKKFVTTFSNVIEKDKLVTDNGDGTLTILILATGNAVVYGPNGKAIARNPGQLRFKILVGDNGTPDNPFDDKFLADLGVVKESTGRSDDFCTAVVGALS